VQGPTTGVEPPRVHYFGPCFETRQILHLYSLACSPLADNHLGRHAAYMATPIQRLVVVFSIRSCAPLDSRRHDLRQMRPRAPHVHVDS
jgi:hypothetical protein